MGNTKATERLEVAIGFGFLLQPLVELAKAPSPPSATDYAIALARMRGGDAAWRETVSVFTTFAPDIRFADEYNEISHIPERLGGVVRELIPSAESARGEAQYMIAEEVRAAQGRFTDLIHRVPVEWKPQRFEANTPFTAYRRIREAMAAPRHRVHYFDRYLSPDFFDMFLGAVPPTTEVRLVSTAKGTRAVEKIAKIVGVEFSDFQLIEVSHSVLHDRNLRVDDQAFSLGPGTDQAGMAITNFDPADSTPDGIRILDRLIASGVVRVRS